MKTYKIEVIQTVDDDALDYDDLNDNPSGQYTITAKSEDDALDEFHAKIPIACLDDFSISIEEDL